MTPVPVTAPLDDQDLLAFHAGTHRGLHHVLGAQPGLGGTWFSLWAPHARAVSVLGDFNNWAVGRHRMAPRGTSGIWQIFVAGAGPGTRYTLVPELASGVLGQDRADPLGAGTELPPAHASVVSAPEHAWQDGAWMEARPRQSPRTAAISIYEVHLGSWMRVPEEGHRFLTYRELADRLVHYVRERGFTHVELLPVMEHAAYAGWGYQATAWFAPTRRHGAPADFMHLVDTLHQAGIGVLLDWAPGHFPEDPHGLANLDGTPLYERPGAGPRRFNLACPEVRSFLLSSAACWLERYHIDGLRVAALAEFLGAAEAVPGGARVPDPEAVAFLQHFNATLHSAFPGVLTVAEESTARPGVTLPVRDGGLGFDFKWDVGWAHDTLHYFSLAAAERRQHHPLLTFRALYQHQECFVLPLAHDEVVQGKGSLLSRMPGDAWQKRANLRLLLGYQSALPGKKLLFMGGEFGPWREWTVDESLDWHLLPYPEHQGLQRWSDDLQRLLRCSPALHALDADPRGFQWIDCQDRETSTLSLVRRAGDAQVVVVCNFTAVPRHGFNVGVDCAGPWRELLNSDARVYGGTDVGNHGRVEAWRVPCHGRPASLHLTLPPLGVLFLEPLRDP